MRYSFMETVENVKHKVFRVLNEESPTHPCEETRRYHLFGFDDSSASLTAFTKLTLVLLLPWVLLHSPKIDKTVRQRILLQHRHLAITCASFKKLGVSTLGKVTGRKPFTRWCVESVVCIYRGTFHKSRSSAGYKRLSSFFGVQSSTKVGVVGAASIARARTAEKNRYNQTRPFGSEATRFL